MSLASMTDALASAMLWLVLGVALALLGGCGGGTEKLRYRMTVEVDTPAGVRTGSGVQELAYRSKIHWLPGDSAQNRTRGEAIAVDLPGGTLLVLIRPSASALVAETLMHGSISPAIDTSGAKDWNRHEGTLIRGLRRAGARLRLTPQQCGERNCFQSVGMIRFRDIHDPRTMETVEAADLAKSFGQGVRLRAITIEATEAPVTYVLETRLRWLKDIPKYRTVPENSFTNILPGVLIGLRDDVRM